MGKPKSTEIYTNMVKRIATRTNMHSYQVRNVMIEFIRLTIEDLCQGKEIVMMSLGKFWLKKYPPGRVFNPHEKSMEDRGERYVPKFNFGPTTRDFIRKEALKLNKRTRN